MTTRIGDAVANRKKIVHPRQWSVARGRWEEDLGGNPLPGLERSMFTPYIGAGTIWQRNISTMPLHAQSATMAAYMWSESPTRFNTKTGGDSGAFGSKTSFNTSAFGTQPIATAIVDSTDPYCHFQYMDSGALPGGTNAERDAMILGKIPWPFGFNPAANGDKGLAIYDIGTGILREWFTVNAVANKPGHWTCGTGGYSLAKPHFRDWAASNYPTQLQNGSSAVVLMHNSLGFVGIDEVRAGKINHALAFTIANAIADEPASWPGVWSDGKFPRSDWVGWTENGGTNGPYPGPSPRHGQWGRLKSTVDPMYNPRSGAPFFPLTRILIVAAKTYGLCPTDTNAFAHAFNAESGNREKALSLAMTGAAVDPWTATTGELAKLLRPDDPGKGLAVEDFPWDQTEWAPFDWGRPNPDFKLRPGERFPYEPH